MLKILKNKFLKKYTEIYFLEAWHILRGGVFLLVDGATPSSEQYFSRATQQDLEATYRPDAGRLRVLLHPGLLPPPQPAAPSPVRPIGVLLQGVDVHQRDHLVQLSRAGEADADRAD